MTKKLVQTARLKKILPLLSVLFLLTGSQLSLAQQPLVIYANSGVMKVYDEFIAGRKKVEITDYTLDSLHSSRSVLETLLFEQALELGGFKKPIKLASERIDYDSKLQLLRSGKALAYTEAFLGSDFSPYKDELFISEPLIRKNEYFVGLYTSPQNTKALSATKETLSELTATSNNTWAQDWKALNNIGLKKVFHVASWIYMVKMVKNQKADIILSHFQPGEGMPLMWEGHDLVPIPNLKLALPGSRNFIISKKHPAGEDLYRALNMGIEKLRASGRIKKAYEQAGIFNSKVKDWVPLGLEQ